MLITSTRLTVTRPADDDDAADDYGYPTETLTVLDSGVRAWVSESSQITEQRTSGGVARVESWEISVPPQATAVEIRERDRLADETTGLVYLVLAVATTTGLFQRNRSFTCSRVA